MQLQKYYQIKAKHSNKNRWFLVKTFQRLDDADEFFIDYKNKIKHGILRLIEFKEIRGITTQFTVRISWIDHEDI